MSEDLQVAVDHDRDSGALIDMDHGPDRQIVLHHALGAVAQVRADVARDVGRGLILNLSGGRRRQGPDQRDQRGRAEALREAGIDKTGGAGAAELDGRMLDEALAVSARRVLAKAASE